MLNSKWFSGERYHFDEEALRNLATNHLVEVDVLVNDDSVIYTWTETEEGPVLSVTKVSNQA